MADKSITISIEKTQLQYLKDNEYVLCFAKGVQKGSSVDFTVASVVLPYSGNNQFTSNNTFTWTPEYGLNYVNKFEDGVQVSTDGDPINVELGSQVVIDSSGNMQGPTSQSNHNAMVIVNNFEPLNPVVLQNVNGVLTPIYVAQFQLIANGAVDTLTPVQICKVWFAQNISTSTMISAISSAAQTFDLTNYASGSSTYQANGTWSPAQYSN